MRCKILPFLACAALAVMLAGRPVLALTVQPVTAGALKQAVHIHRGHIVLVNFWATWCIPCMKEFGDLVHVSNADKSRGLVVLAVTGDKPHDIQGRVIPFLTAHHATFAQYIISGDLDTFVNGFDPQWQADFPQTFIFNRQGRLVKDMTGPQNFHTWQRALQPLLKRARAH